MGQFHTLTDLTGPYSASANQPIKHASVHDLHHISSTLGILKHITTALAATSAITPHSLIGTSHPKYMYKQVDGPRTFNIFPETKHYFIKK